MDARLAGLYALRLYLPFSAADEARRLRRRARRDRQFQPTRLLQVGWLEVLPRSSIYLVATRKRNGNVSLSELAVLAQAAAASAPGSEIIEIGTFNGRTTINLSVNAPKGSTVFTLDLPPAGPRISSSLPTNGYSWKVLLARVFGIAPRHGRA